MLIDLVVNHTSNEHPWFKEARKYLKSKYRDPAIVFGGSLPGEELLGDDVGLQSQMIGRNQTRFRWSRGSEPGSSA